MCDLLAMREKPINRCKFGRGPDDVRSSAHSLVCHETYALLGTARSQLVSTFSAHSLAHDFASFSGSQDVFGVKNQGGQPCR